MPWLPQLLTWFCTWQICTTTLYGDSWMALTGAQHLLQGPAEGPEVAPHQPGQDWAAAHALLYRKTAKEKLLTQNDHNAIRCVLSHLVSSVRGQAGPSASMERKLPTTWGFTLSTTWVRESCASAASLSGPAKSKLELHTGKPSTGSLM